MLMLMYSMSRWIGFAVAIGVAAGALAYWIGTLGVRGPVVFIAYTTLVLVTAVYVHVRKAPLFIRFATVLVAFMTAILVHYVAINQFDKHGLRFVIVILAIVLLMAVSWLRAHRVESLFERFSLTMVGCAVSTFFVYVFLTKVANPRKVTIEVWSDLWANGLLLALIMLCSILVARVTTDRQPRAE